MGTVGRTVRMGGHNGAYYPTLPLLDSFRPYFGALSIYLLVFEESTSTELALRLLRGARPKIEPSLSKPPDHRAN